MILLMEDSVVVCVSEMEVRVGGGDNNSGSSRFIVKETGIALMLLSSSMEEDTGELEIDLSDEIVDHLVSKSKVITVCSGSAELSKAVSSFKFNRDDLLKKQGAWELLQELQAK